MSDELEKLEKDLEALQKRLDGVYEERDTVVALLARMCDSAGWNAGIGPASDAEKGFTRVVFIETPEGQLSWHYNDKLHSLFESLPEHPKKWDGHTTEEKYIRLRSAIQKIDQINQRLAHMRARMQ